MTDQPLTLDPTTSALLVMDFQSRIVEGHAVDSEALLERTRLLLEAARAAQLLVVYVVVGFRAGYPEVSRRNQSFAAILDSGRFAEGDRDAAIHPQLAAAPGEPVVTKHRVGAFGGTDLEMILRAHNIETLLLCGIATSGVVLSTLRCAADADYRIVVASDCCSDSDAEVHRVLTEKVFPRQARVVCARDIIAAL
jgi:nicotinamidase-related amidase